MFQDVPASLAAEVLPSLASKRMCGPPIVMMLASAWTASSCEDVLHMTHIIRPSLMSKEDAENGPTNSVEQEDVRVAFQQVRYPNPPSVLLHTFQ